MSETTIAGEFTDYEELYRNFRWTIPPLYNIGVDVVDRHLAARGDKVAVLYEDETGTERQYTFRQVADLSNRFANVLRHYGCGKGDRVAILLPQLPETGIAHAAIYKLGAIAVPMSNLFGPDAIEYRLRDSGARAILTDPTGSEKLEAMRDGLPGLRRVFITDGRAADGELSFRDEVERASPEFDPVPTRAEDPAFIIYTSGTTGPPKGVLHAHRALLGHLPGFELSHEFFPQPGDRFWTPADWAWAGGLLDALLPAWHYGRAIVGSKFSRRFDPERAFWLIDKYGIRNVFLPPTALKMMQRAPDPKARHKLALRTIMSAGEALGPEILAWAAGELGLTINEMFGQSEANYVVGNCHELMPVKPGSMGRPYPGHRVEIVDPAGHVLSEAGATGEIAVRRDTPVMFLEYWNKPEATSRKFCGDWMLTGDVAIRDDDGYFFFKGRGDDLISSAGYRIGPTEVEECLLKHPAVALAAVIGVPDDLRGQVIKAFIQLAPGFRRSDGLKGEIQGHVKQRLAAYEYPRVIEFIDEIPMTTTGKIKRDELRRREQRQPST